MSTRGGRRRAHTMAFLAVIAALALTGCNDFFAAGWGNNQYGQLGTGTTVSSSVPVDVNTSTVLQDKVVVQVEAGTWDSCATTADGTGACWGALAPIPLNPVWETLPYQVPDTGVLAGKTITKVVPVGSGETRCALTSDGAVGCWRNNQGPVFTPGWVPPGSQVVQMASECALTAAGVLKCGIGLIGAEVVNATGVLAGKAIVQITNRCALTSDNLIACWGFNNVGQRGDGTTSNTNTPEFLFTPSLVVQDGAMAGRTVASISGGPDYNCAVTDDGAGFCWGGNAGGQLGTGNTSSSNVPVQVAHVGALAEKGIASLSGGQDHACAILDDQSMACWGKNTSGQLGNGSTVDSLVPVAVSALPNGEGQPRPVVATAAGGAFNLAVYQEQVPSQFVPVSPRRVLDTRAGGGAPVGPGGQVTFSLADVVPVGTTAVAYNLTATGQTASGAAALVPGGSAVSAGQTSVINWSGPLQTIANGFLVKVPASRQLAIKLNSSGSSHFVVDVTGYFVGPGDPDGTLYNPADERIYDSRLGDGPLAPGQSRVLNVMGSTPMAAGAGSGGWPAAALEGSMSAGAAVNLTVTGTVGSGVMSVAKDALTTTSTVNWTGPAQTVANAVITDVAVDGSFTVTNNGRTPADVVVDLMGTFLPAGVSGGASFFPMDPDRSYDSRATNGRLLAGQSRGNTFPVPADAVAVAVNTTITGTFGTGFLSVTPPPFTTVPTTSMVNWFTSPTTRANGAIVPVERTATRAYTGGNFSTEYLYDTAGFFR